MSVELDSRLAGALQVQMNRELVAALTYKQMRDDMQLSAWHGFHKFFSEQTEEELGHAHDFEKYLADRNVRPMISTIQIGTVLYSPENPLYYFETALDLEKLYWTYIEDLYQMSEDLDDPDTCKMLYEKVQAQHDSVAELVDIVTRMKRAGMNIAAMQEIDRDFSE